MSPRFEAFDILSRRTICISRRQLRARAIQSPCHNHWRWARNERSCVEGDKLVATTSFGKYRRQADMCQLWLFEKEHDLWGYKGMCGWNGFLQMDACAVSQAPDRLSRVLYRILLQWHTIWGRFKCTYLRSCRQRFISKCLMAIVWASARWVMHSYMAGY